MERLGRPIPVASQEGMAVIESQDIVSNEERQAIVDGEHLRLLAVFHYISGGVTVTFSLLFGIWLIVMAAMFAFIPFPEHAGTEAAAAHVPGPPAVLFVAFGLFFLVGVAYGILEIVAGRFISQRRRRVFTLVVALPRVVFLPYGVILSVFTLLVLERRAVKQLYRAQDPALASS